MIEQRALRSSHSRTVVQTPGLPWTGLRPLPQQMVQLVLLVLGIALLTFILFLYVLPNSQISLAKTRIAVLRSQTDSVDRQIAEIDRQIATYTDLHTLEQRAKALGMAPPRQAIFSSQ